MINSIKIEFDRDYGINKRTGWSVFINGFCLADLENWLIVAIVKAFYKYFFILDD